MGRRSESEDEYDYEARRSKKKKKKRSRSRSDDSSSSRYSSKHKKYKKVKHRKHSRSRSRDRSYRRSRSRSVSRSRDRYRSRSRDRRGRRRSRSRSGNRRSRSHSSSRNRRSRSRSRGKGRQTGGPSDISQQIPGFHDMTAGEQVNARMKLALRAAAAADEKIREQMTGVPYVEDVKSFGKAVAKIERDSFAPTTFKSSRNEKKAEPKEASYSTHEHAMFGAGTFDIKMEPTKLIYVEPESYAHPNLYCDLDEKMDRWIQKLNSMRRKRMEGDAF